MNEIIREELFRFGRKLISYAKFVFGGMLVATLFFFFYGGITEDYFVIQIIAAVFSTLSILVLSALAVGWPFRLYHSRQRHLPKSHPGQPS